VGKRWETWIRWSCELKAKAQITVARQPVCQCGRRVENNRTPSGKMAANFEATQSKANKDPRYDPLPIAPLYRVHLT